MSFDGSSRPKSARECGDFPHRQPLRSWAGPGTGKPCSICGRSIPREEFELELEFGENDGGTHIVHVSCFRSWRTEEPGKTGTSTLRGGDRDITVGGDDSQLPTSSRGASDPR